MSMSKHFLAGIAGILLTCGCSQTDSNHDETDAVQQNLGNPFLTSNNQILQGCSGWINATGTTATLQGLMEVESPAWIAAES